MWACFCGRAPFYFFGICYGGSSGWNGLKWRRSPLFVRGKPRIARRVSFGVGHNFAIGWSKPSVLSIKNGAAVPKSFTKQQGRERRELFRKNFQTTSRFNPTV
jgi:hypothetical protein